MRALIIDDEDQSRSAIREALRLHSDRLQVIAEATSVAQAVRLIDDLHPDLLLLDIQLGDGSGFDVIEQAGWKQFRVIFITAYSEYALQAFRVNAQAYLLKPVENTEVTLALDKVCNIPSDNKDSWKPLLEYVKNTYEKICFSSAEGYHLYTRDEIIRCEADNNYSRIYLQSGEQLYVAKTLKELETQLGSQLFERIHKSHLINTRHLRKYLNRDGGSVLLTDGTVLPVSQRKKPEMIRLLTRSNS